MKKSAVKNHLGTPSSRGGVLNRLYPTPPYPIHVKKIPLGAVMGVLMEENAYFLNHHSFY